MTKATFEVTDLSYNYIDERRVQGERRMHSERREDLRFDLDSESRRAPSDRRKSLNVWNGAK